MYAVHVGPTASAGSVGGYLMELANGRSSALFAFLAGFAVVLITGRRTPKTGLAGRGQELGGRQPRVQLVLGHQFLVGAHGPHSSGVHDGDPVGACHRRQPVGHHQHGGVAGHLRDDVPHRQLVDGLELRGRLVEQQQPGLAQQCACDGDGDGDALPLAARQLRVAVSHRRVQAVGRRSTRVSSFVLASTSRMPSSVAPGAAKTRLSRSVPASTGASCSTYPMADRSRGSDQSRTSSPSTRTRPPVAS